MNAWVVVLGGVLLVLLGLGVARLLAARGASSRRSDGAQEGVTKLWAAGQSQLDPATPRGYSPGNVGNDASARPWESAFDATAGASPATAAAALAHPPDGFDVPGFLHTSKANFVSLQDAWDRADMPRLRAMMTHDMLEQIQGQLLEREQLSGGQPGKTEVVMIEAQLLGLEDMGEGHMASVEFSGLMREDASAGPSPFREIWSIVRAKSGRDGWLVAGVQALQ